jgi:ergothioneine biosynthesis protein EgtB
MALLREIAAPQPFASGAGSHAGEAVPGSNTCRERRWLIDRFREVRRQSEVLCHPLEIEDYGVQSMPSVSPPKWHLAHTSWFFETFILQPHQPRFQPYNAAFAELFNSYYQGVGRPFARDQRGVLSRPTVAEIYCYRAATDERMLSLLRDVAESKLEQIRSLTLLGLAHEEQHQELLLTDIKFNFSRNPLLPAYAERESPADNALEDRATSRMTWLDFAGGHGELGSNGARFCFDNELPRHRVWLAPFRLASRPITNGEFLQFMRDGGYRRPELWLSDGWTECQQQGWRSPLYWTHGEDAKSDAFTGGHRDGKWQVFTLHGLRPLNLAEPVCHVSYYEADAYARWADARLPTEAEWEYVASEQEICGHFANDGILQPRPASRYDDSLQQLFGDVWEWTASAYAPYPGFRADTAPIGEYNGKFMCNQMVLRGGSCATAREHVRASYRNFFYPADRWQFSGIRLARSAD